MFCLVIVLLIENASGHKLVLPGGMGVLCQRQWVWWKLTICDRLQLTNQLDTLQVLWLLRLDSVAASSPDPSAQLVAGVWSVIPRGCA